MFRILCLLFFTLSMTMCASSKQYTLADLPEERMEFEFGGGFTGQYDAYLLLPNGQLFHRRQVINELPWREYDPVDPKTAKELFTTYNKQNLAALGYNDPGNMTYTITKYTPKDTSQLVWGGSQEKPSEELKTYWRRVMAVVNDKRPLPVTK